MRVALFEDTKGGSHGRQPTRALRGTPFMLSVVAGLCVGCLVLGCIASYSNWLRASGEQPEDSKLAHRNELGDAQSPLSGRAVKALPLYLADDLDKTTFGKSSQASTMLSRQNLRLSMSALRRPDYRATRMAAKDSRLSPVDDRAGGRAEQHPNSRAAREALKTVVGAGPVAIWAGAAQSAELPGKDEIFGTAKNAVSMVQTVGGGLWAGIDGAVWSPLQGFMNDPTVRQIGLSLANTVIAWAVPVGAALVILGTMSSPKGEKEGQSPFDFFNKKPGGVTEYLKIERLNDQLDSYSYSVTKALYSAKKANLDKQREVFRRSFGTEMAAALNETQIQKIATAGKKFETQMSELRAKSAGITQEMRADAAKTAGEVPSGMMKKMFNRSGQEGLQSQQNEIAAKASQAEVEYIKAIGKELPHDLRLSFSKLLQTSKIDRVDGSFVSMEELPWSKPHVWCLKFNGDIQAGQLTNLRKEVTAVIRAANASRQDEVVLNLRSPGGTVTGYGSAAAQLLRIKNAGLKLTVCVEEVAASGGYMMACVADHLVASPMAVLGSIGVIQELPNAYERLEREGVKFLTVTAGEYKRTLTPFKKPTSQDEKKTKEDIGMVWGEFKAFVKEQRPVLDVEKYGTGETWFGNEALRRKLCDEIANSEDVILDKLDSGAEIYGVKYKDPKTNPLAEQLLPSGLAEYAPSLRTLLGRLLLGESMADIIQERPAATSRYPMAIDRTSMNTYLMDEP